MTAIVRALGAALPDAPVSPCAIGAVTVATQAQALAASANSAAMDNPTGRLYVDQPTKTTTGAYGFLYTPRANIAFLRLKWFFPALSVASSAPTGMSASVKLAITDGTNTIPYTDARIGHGFDGTLEAAGPSLESATLLGSIGGQLDLDIAACSSGSPALDPTVSWTLTFTVGNLSAGLGALARIQGQELPRWSTDETAVGRGMAVGDFLADIDINDDPQLGLPRIVDTVASARTLVQATYLSLSYEQSITSDTPTTTSGTDHPFGNLEEDSTHPILFTVPTRQIAPASAVGAALRWGVIYYTQGGVGLTVSLHTGSSSTPFSASLPDTAALWVWSGWQTGLISTAAGTDVLSFTGHLASTGGSKQAWVAGFFVEGLEP